MADQTFKSNETRMVEALERLAQSAEEIASHLEDLHDSIWIIKELFEECTYDSDRTGRHIKTQNVTVSYD